MNYFLLFLLFLFSFLSNINISFYGELSFLELFQSTILATCFFIHLSCKTLFLKLSNAFIFIIRLFLYLFLFYEEISFLSIDSIPLFQAINYQSEINIHNLNIVNTVLFGIRVPFSNHISQVTLLVFVFTIFFLFSVSVRLYLVLSDLDTYFWKGNFQFFPLYFYLIFL